jgi:hypothetical protein
MIFFGTISPKYGMYGGAVEVYFPNNLPKRVCQLIWNYTREIVKACNKGLDAPCEANCIACSPRRCPKLPTPNGASQPK